MLSIGKRVFDVVVASIGLIILMPVLIIIALIIRKTIGSPVIYRQNRPGLNGNIFELVKFRTMLVKYGVDGELLSDEKRMNELGSFLRTYSLDELPELWNVLKGDMSLIGPRPLLEEYLELYTQKQARRHEVRPGITGWAQVNGRNSITWEEKFDLDVWYVDHQSFLLDMKILWLTAIGIFRHEGISHPGHATMSKFRGS